MASRKNFPGRLEARRQRAVERSTQKSQPILYDQRAEEKTSETPRNNYPPPQIKTTRTSTRSPRLLIRVIGGWAVAVTVVLGLSYWSELPKYQFERVAAEAGHRMPGVRLIGSMKTGYFASPVSWFWPSTTTWNFAVPDPLMRDRFYILTLMYDKNDPSVLLVDADCEDRKAPILYNLEQPQSAFPARDIWGESVVAPNGKTYRRFHTNVALPPKWLGAFCDTDWTSERKAVGMAMQR